MSSLYHGGIAVSSWNCQQFKSPKSEIFIVSPDIDESDALTAQKLTFHLKFLHSSLQLDVSISLAIPVILLSRIHDENNHSQILTDSSQLG
jgi:hypothetical protein